jgi:hypothetical protein
MRKLLLLANALLRDGRTWSPIPLDQTDTLTFLLDDSMGARHLAPAMHRRDELVNEQ